MLAAVNGSNRVDQLSPDASPARVLKSDKRRKLSHADRKEKLEEEIRLLESGVVVLKTRSTSPQVALQTDPGTAEHSALLYATHTQQLHVAKLQSALAQCLTELCHYPLYSRISLTKDWGERRATLLAMRDDKIRAAVEFVMGPGRLNDPMKKQFSQNQFENEHGDLCCVRSDTIQFPGVRSLQQVYDALSFYKNNMEIIITEELGHMTLREDYDAIGDDAFHTRIISTNENGVTTEGNVVSFRAMLGEDEGYGGEPCAVIVSNSVDEDERYPYNPQCVRKDISAAIVLTASKRRATNTSGELNDPLGNMVVTMRRAAFYEVYRPDFPLSTPQFEDLRDSIAQWSDIMLKTVRGVLYPRH
ncbi:hypothetical protein PF005_g9757 [Phytophthora fragariae]|uniref:Uncharacterized protein n=1 Tax=Phytophthora fragariae TaxID=53985 RepID=A0A6A3Y9P8_9STRA|nr:hypothetical protein PF003_g23694 [Phytophthora fragariae]KAE8945953.1 hypothetical protein PF009_g4413 [Phytophthora fragariae]KAE8996668.1 hypothetical protein PF011_g15812 [Phytophthora fragariae]KAE9081100.1 hypothetical protein PF010_g22122 [Phytophthora fragariae]KAE9104565.1 hypothetical protein PF006_g21878 [Phytophthora fragariae]